MTMTPLVIIMNNLVYDFTKQGMEKKEQGRNRAVSDLTPASLAFSCFPQVQPNH